MSLKVRATRRGFYHNLFRRPGDVFALTDETHFSPRWMVRVDPDARERRRTSQDVLTEMHDERLGPTRRCAPAIDDDSDGALTDWDPFTSA